MEKAGQPALLYIDLHLIHEVTSPQAFEAMRVAKRKVRAPGRTFATLDHNIPTIDRDRPIADADSALQVEMMKRNCREFGIPLFDLASPDRASCMSSDPSWD
jgi:3-isopropylmalate/(R)-2-methylmalate dehydratase large subunit